MQLEKFLSEVLPDTGVRFLALNAKQHKAYDDFSKMAEDALAADSNGKAVYFACSSFKTEKYLDDKDKKWKSRTQDNALYTKSIWLDIDCGAGKDYPTRSEAIEAVSVFCSSAAGLSLPIMVSSGNGLHCYWPLEQQVPTDKWMALTRKLRPVYESFGLKFDHSRDCDSASILRVPGTYNRKDPENPRLVEVLDEGGGPVSVRTLVDLIQQHKPATPSYLKNAPLNDDLTLPEREFPPLNAELLATKCAQIKFFKDTGGGDYNAWRASIGILKFCAGGEDLVHTWGSKYAGYNANETQEKYDDWNTAPPTCAAFGNCGNLCDECPSVGKINSPVTLALEVQLQEVEVIAPENGLVGVDEPISIVQLPKGYELNSDRRLCRWINTGAKPSKAEPNPVETFELIEFSETFFYPVSRIQDPDGIMSTQWVAEYDFMGRRAAKSFTVPGKTLGERGSALHGLLAQYEIGVHGTNRSVVEEYMTAFMTKLRAEKEAVKQYKTFGWQTSSHGTEGYLLGSTLISKSDEKQVLTTGKNMAMYSSAFNIAPDADYTKWAAGINKLYNHTHHEQFQFVMYAGFGSALVQFLGEDTGSPINLYGGKGEGKTTCAKMALSIYGDPSKLFLTWKTGTTLNAALKTCAIMRSVPFLFDEFSNAGQELSDVLYAFGNGKDKARSDTQGNLKMDGSTWRNINFLTSNSSLHEKVAVIKDDASAEITRLLEIHWKNESKLDTVQAKTILRDIEPHYGAAAKVFIPWIVENRETVIQIIDKIKEKLDAKIGFTKEFRLWSLQIAAVMAGGFIATKLGLLKFDYKQVEAFAVTLGRTHMLRVSSQVTTTIESFHHMLTHYGQQIISTKEEGDGRTNTVEVRISGEPVGRLILSQGYLYFSVSAIRNWCRMRSIGYEALREELAATGVLLEEGQRYHLGKGTNIATGQIYCWKLSWNNIVGQTAKVTKLQPQLVVRDAVA